MEIKKRFHPNRFCHVASRQPGACIKTVTHHTKKDARYGHLYKTMGSNAIVQDFAMRNPSKQRFNEAWDIRLMSVISAHAHHLQRCRASCSEL